MKRVIAAVALVGAFLASHGLLAGSLEDNYKEGKIKIQKAGPFDKKKHVNIDIGKKVTFKTKVFQDDFLGLDVINANAKIANTTKETLTGVYSIAFFDKDGKLVACHQGRWDLKPGEDINYGSAIIVVDPKSIASVTSYKLKTQVFKKKK